MRRTIGQLSGFSVTVVTNALTGLAVVPVIIHVGGPDGWASVAVGQAAGALASLVLALGWGFNGPTLVATASPTDRQAIVRNSLVARTVFLAPVAFGAAVAAASIAPSLPSVAAVGSLAS